MTGLFKALLLLGLLLALSVEIDARRKWKGRRGKKHDGGHPLRHHLWPKWSDYEVFLPPNEGSANQVEVNMFLREIGPLNIEDRSFRIQVTLRQTFNDSRLSYNANSNRPDFLTLVGDEIDSIWMPDTFVRNERKVIFHDALKPNVYARVYPSGQVETSQRVTLELSCADLKNLQNSGDEASCNLDIASYGYQESALTYDWKKENTIQLSQDTTDFLNDGIEFKGQDLDDCDVETSTGKYSCIRLKLTFGKQ